jgi:hypothetical protein
MNTRRNVLPMAAVSCIMQITCLARGGCAGVWQSNCATLMTSGQEHGRWQMAVSCMGTCALSAGGGSSQHFSCVTILME